MKCVWHSGVGVMGRRSHPPTNQLPTSASCVLMYPPLSRLTRVVTVWCASHAVSRSRSVLCVGRPLEPNSQQVRAETL